MKSLLLFALCLFSLSPLLAQSRFPAGLVFDDAAYEQLEIQPVVEGMRLAGKHSLKKHAPPAQDQGVYNNCVGWAVAYGARTILLAQEKGWTDPARLKYYAFSPSFTYKLISQDRSCESAVSIEQALYSLSKQGAIFMREVPNDCVRRLPSATLSRARRYTIDSYKRLFYRDATAQARIKSVKQALAQDQPVVLGMRCPPSFEHADGQSVWRPKESPRTRNTFGHAVCVVGYDDQKYGGAFEVMNSWGNKWGDEGFIWIRYEDFAAFSKYAYVPSVNSGSTYRSESRSIPSMPVKHNGIPFIFLFLSCPLQAGRSRSKD